MILGVLEARCDHSFAGQDIFLNVAGGLKISEPAADLAVACALLSALYDDPLCPHTIFFGEIGLSGEVRRVSHIDGRLKEAFKLGFKKAVGPAGPKKTPLPAIETGDFHYQSLVHLRDLSALIEGDPKPKKPRKTFSGITPQEF
jgi:DNA repair protein RadA/Sms